MVNNARLILGKMKVLKLFVWDFFKVLSKK